MSSIKLLLKENKINQKGEAPIYIRIIKNRKSKFISTGIYVFPEQWDDENKRVYRGTNCSRINNRLAKMIADANGIALEMESKNKFVSTARLKSKLLGVSTESFSNYAYQYLDSLKSNKKFGTHDKVNAVLSKLSKYTKGANLLFSDIDYEFLKDYESYLKSKLKNSTNTIHSNLKVFRKLFNDAIREGIIEPDLNPFIRYKLKLEKTRKEYLTENELKVIENLNFENNHILNLHRNTFIFAAYAGGIRVSDILKLKWSNFDGLNITFRMQKTDEMLSIRLPNKALEIINNFAPLDDRNPSDFIFPFISNDIEIGSNKFFKALQSSTAHINKSLKKIALLANLNKKISFHSSRHTWATRALRKGMRIEYVSKLMGHATIKTTQIYSKIVNSELDNAMDVFND